MRYTYWKRLSQLALGGAILLQLPTCTEFSQGVVTISSALTAGGLIYLIQKILN